MSIIKSKTLNPKRSASKLLKEMPDDCTYEDIQYHLYVLQKIEKGLTDAMAGKTYSTDQMKLKLKRWIRK
ncbi:MAG: hypothetical protein IAE93_01520 [Ignavibacteria bacterium]|nr:hypothetical protein [Ignavibacteria bacterium]HAX49362.1 hypothetical protein [Bacteroidota bacterium]HRJ84864.1 hypothetical protein [Ignavibacteria bacterium]